MTNKPDWLWDRGISAARARKILTDERHPKFVEIAALLLARKNTPKEIFNSLLGKDIFVRNWPRIKRRMRQDKWTEPRIVFWQAVYEKIVDIFKKNGGVIRPAKTDRPRDELCGEVGEQIRELRKRRALTQADLAKKLGVSQQVVSRVEGGRGNVRLLTVKEIARALDCKIQVHFVQP